MPTPFSAPAETFSGARALFRVGSNLVGYCSDFSGSEAVAYEERHVLGLLAVSEHVPVGYAASCSASFFRIIGKGVKAQGIMPTYENILTSGALSCSVNDTITGQTPYQFMGVRATDNSFDVNARGIVSERQSFVAIRRLDEYDAPLAG